MICKLQALFKWSTLVQQDPICVLATIEGSGLCRPSTSSSSPALYAGERGKEDLATPKFESLFHQGRRACVQHKVLRPVSITRSLKVLDPKGTGDQPTEEQDLPA